MTFQHGDFGYEIYTKGMQCGAPFQGVIDVINKDVVMIM